MSVRDRRVRKLCQGLNIWHKGRKHIRSLGRKDNKVKSESADGHVRTLWSALPSSFLCSLSVWVPLSSFSVWHSVPVLSVCGGEWSSLCSALPSPISPFTSPAVSILTLSLFLSCLSSVTLSCSICATTPLDAGLWASCGGAGTVVWFSWIPLGSVCFWWARWAGLQLDDLLICLSGELSLLFSVLLEGTEEKAKEEVGQYTKGTERVN